jgi:hypothetical protein
MNRNAAAVLTAVWLAALLAAFAALQSRGFLQEVHAASYLRAALSAAAVFLVATGLGLRVLPDPAPGLGPMVKGAALGLSLLGLAVLLLGFAGVITPPLLWALILGAGILSLKSILRVFRYLTALITGFDSAPCGFLCLLAAAAALLLVGCLAPLTANDALVYHVNLPKIYTQASQVVRLPHNVYANMPHNGEILYTLFYGVAGEAGAKLAYLLLTLGAGAAVYALARRFTGRRPALVAAAAFLVQPLILDPRVVANIDTPMAMMFMAAVLIALDADPARGLRPFIGLGLVAGFMLGMKYTAIVPGLALLLPLVAGPHKPSARGIALAAGLAVAVLAPWLAKNQVFMGNPVYPVLEGLFDGRYWDTVQAERLAAWQRGMGMGRGFQDYILLPFRLTFLGKPAMDYSRFDGMLNPAILGLFPLVFIRRRRTTMLLAAMALAAAVFWALTSQQMRFLIPALALMAALGGIGLGDLGRRLKGGHRPASFLLAMILVASLAIPDQQGRPFITNILGDKLAPALGLESREAHLERSVQSYAVFREINRRLPPEEKLFMIWENRGYYLDRPYFADSFFEASSVMRMAEKAGSGRALAERIGSMGYRYVLVNDLLGQFFSRAYDPATQSIVRSMIDEHLSQIYSANGITVFRLP